MTKRFFLLTATLIFIGISLSDAQRKDYALLFATDEYDNFDNLNTIEDAKKLVNILESQYDFEAELVENFTTQDVIHKIRQYFGKEYTEHDQLFIYFAGHGYFDIVFKQGYVACKNSTESEEDFTSYVEFARLRNLVNRIPCNHILFAINTGFAKYFDPEMTGASTRMDSVAFETKEVSVDDKLKDILSKRSRLFIACSEDAFDEESYKSYVEQMITALESKGGDDNMLNMDELTNQMYNSLPVPRMGGFGANELGSDFVFIAQ